MDDSKKNKFFLLVGFHEIRFTALNENNEILLDKELISNDTSYEQNLKTLQNFLDKYFFDLEKKLNNYINEVYLILNYKDFLTVDVSTIHGLNNFNDQSDNMSNFLINIKNDVFKDIDGFDLAHMIINKFIINGKEHLSIQNYKDYENILFEIKFICFKSNILTDLKKIFSKYGILIKNFSCYEYVNNFKKSEEDNIFDIADKLRNGLNKKEILFINRPLKNNGFFEKFFNFFN